MSSNALFLGGMKLPEKLSEDETNKLFVEFSNGSKEAHDKLILHNIRLVLHLVNKYSNVDYDMDDLVSIGNIGLIKAVDTFDSKKGSKFSTYASRIINNEILMFLRKSKKYQNIESFERIIANNDDGNDIKLEHILKEENDFIFNLEKDEEKTNIRKIVDSLPKRDKEIVMLYFGFDNEEKITQVQIAERYGISRSYVSRILERVIKKIKVELIKMENANNHEKSDINNNLTTMNKSNSFKIMPKDQNNSKNNSVSNEYLFGKWMENYEIAKRYYQEYENLLVPQSYSLNISDKKVNLGLWVYKQRQAYKNNKLDEQKITLLNNIGMVWDAEKYKGNANKNTISNDWVKNYLIAKRYYQKEKNLLIKRDYYVEIDGTIFKLGNWIYIQRRAYKNNKLNKKKIDLLNNIGMIWNDVLYNDELRKNTISNEWMRNYELAKKYYEENNDLLVPKRYILSVGDDSIKLGYWISDQRRAYKNNKLSEKQVKLLNKIGMIWGVEEYKANKNNITYDWNEKYELAEAYYEEYGNLLIPQNHSLNVNNEKINLGLWISTQRRAYKNNKLSKKQIELLNNIGMIWDAEKYKGKINKNTISNQWMKNYEIAKDYYDKNGNLYLPARYVLYTSEKPINIGYWIYNQRQAHKNDELNQKQIDLLNDIGMIWNFDLQEYNKVKEITSEKWMKNYELAKKYYEENNNLLIPKSYILSIGDDSIKLGYWINYQRKAYKNNKLNQKQIDLLNDIGMIWELKLNKDNLNKSNEHSCKNVIKYVDDEVNNIKKCNVSFDKEENTLIKGLCTILSEFRNESSFVQMLNTLSVKEALIMSLMLGFINGKCFSKESIINFLGISEEDILNTVKKVLMLYKEDVNNIIDCFSNVMKSGVSKVKK